jgi:hypothetical protein
MNIQTLLSRVLEDPGVLIYYVSGTDINDDHIYHIKSGFFLSVSVKDKEIQVLLRTQVGGNARRPLRLLSFKGNELKSKAVLEAIKTHEGFLEQSEERSRTIKERIEELRKQLDPYRTKN